MGIGLFHPTFVGAPCPSIYNWCKQGPPCIMASAFITVEHGERKHHP